MAELSSSRLPRADAWPCEITEANFKARTVTVKMLTNDYRISAGQHWLTAIEAAPQDVNGCPHGAVDTCCDDPEGCAMDQTQPADADQVAELEQEARLMRARMERLQAERDELLEALERIAQLDRFDARRILDADPVYVYGQCGQIALDAVNVVEGRV